MTKLHMAGTLYVVGTPIGNLEDISLRALRVLKEADLIAAEDTRVTRKLLSRYDIHTPLTSFHQHSRGAKVEAIVCRLQSGESVALVSDAGTPGISDPGADLIDLAINALVPVVPIPGPNAAIAALVVSGLPSGKFSFLGFPPRTKTDRKAFFSELAQNCFTSVIYESPGRLLASLKELYAAAGNRRVAIGRELTKLFEEIFRGDLASAIGHFDTNKPRGEFTLVIAPPERMQQDSEPERLDIALRTELGSGASSRDAVLRVSKRLNLPRRFVYQSLIRMTGEQK